MTGPQSSFDRVREVFAAVVDLEPEDRRRRLAELCRDDSALRGEVEDLLDCLSTPAPELRGFDNVAGSNQGGGVDRRHPDWIGPYRIQGVLGAGGMGIVYRAEQQRPRRPVALKVLQPGLVREETLSRFAQEAEVLALLQDPGIARIYDAGSFDFGYGEMPYFAMELVDGAPLHRFVAENGLNQNARLELFARICESVQHAHERGVIHRDLKPSNILVVGSRTGAAGPQPKILDFGIAKSTDADQRATTSRTSTGQMLGTLPYMSPEQVDGAEYAVDPRTDVYSLGVVLYELLVGHLPLSLAGRGLSEAARIVRETEPVSLGRVDRSLRGDVETIVHKALAKDRSERYGSAAELAHDVQSYLRNEPISARRQTTWYQLRKYARRNKTLIGGVVATILALAIGLGVTINLASTLDQVAKRESQLRESETDLRVAESQARKRADAIADRSRRELYRSQMRLAGQSLRSASSRVRIREIVDEWRPPPGGEEPDLRGWEWRLCAAHLAVGRRIGPKGAFETSIVGWPRDRSLLYRSTAASEPSMLYELNGDPASPDRWLPARPYREWNFAERSSRVALKRKMALDVLDSVDGEPVATYHFRRHAEAWLFDLTPDGQWLAVGIFDGAHPERGGLVRVMNALSGEVRAEFSAPFRRKLSMAFSPDGRWLAVDHNARNGAVGIYRADWSPGSAGENPAIWPLHRELRNPRSQMTCLDWHPSEPLVAVAYRNGGVLVFDLAGEVVAEVVGPVQLVHRVRWHPDGNALAIGSDDGSILLWERARDAVRIVGAAGQPVDRLEFCPDGSALASSRGPAIDGSTFLWDLTKASALRTLVEPSGSRSSAGQIGWLAGGQRLALCRGGRVRVLERASGALIEEWAGRGLAVGAKGRWLAWLDRGVVHRVSIDAEGRVGVEQASRWRLPKSAGEKISLLRHGEVAIAGRLECWRWPVGEDGAAPTKVGSILRMQGRPRAPGVYFETLSGTMEWLRDDGSVATVGRVLGRAWDWAFEPGGQRLARACRERVVRVHRMDSLEFFDLVGHSDRVLSVDWSPDRSRIASGGRDRTVRIWDVSARAEVMAFQVPDEVLAVDWSPDGEALAALCRDGSLRLWDAAP